MAKQKTIFSRIMRKVRQDSGSAWNRRYISAFQAASEAEEPIPEEARVLQGDGFIRTMQLEAMLSELHDEMRVEEEQPFIYPGLMAAWESAPATVEFDAAAVRYAEENEAELLGTPLGGVWDVFPACLLLDIRPFALSLYHCDCDGLFLYPSYNRDRGYPVILALAVSAREGLDFPLSSKIVLKGESFGEALDNSESERAITRQRCLGRFADSRFTLIHSPLDDDSSVCDVSALALALVCSDRTVVEELPGSRERRLRVRLAAKGEVTAAPAEAPEADVEMPGDASSAPDDDKASEGEFEPSPEVGDESSLITEDTTTPEDKPESPVGSEGGASSEDATVDVVEPDADDAADTGEPDAASAASAEQDETDLSSAASGNPTDEVVIAELYAKISSLETSLAQYEQKASSLDFHLRQAQAAAAQAKVKAAALQQRAELVEHMDLPSTPLEVNLNLPRFR